MEVDYILYGFKGPDKTREYEFSSAHSSLFRAFADLAPTTEGIFSFACRYGPLGIGLGLSGKSREFLAARTARRRQSRPPEYYEEVSHWKEEIAEMGSFVALWESIANRDTAGLNQVISFNEREQAIMYRSSVSLPRRGTRRALWRGRRLDIDSPSGGPCPRGDLIESASYILADALSDKVRLYAGLPTVAYERGCFRNRVVPKNLIGALWFQFASAVVRRAKFGQCAHCGGYFECRSEGGGQGKRAGAKYCSDTCRVRWNERNRSNTSPSV